MARNVRDIRRDIQEHRREMKQSGIPVRCTMNRLESPVFRANMRLEALKLELDTAVKERASGE
jgi:hypothetical protein